VFKRTRRGGQETREGWLRYYALSDALWLGSLSYASTRLIAALGSARPRLPRRLVPRRTLIQPDGLTVCCCSNPGAPHWFKPGKAGWRK